MNWVPGNNRPCGRPPRTWLNIIEKDLKAFDPNLDLKTAELIAQNRAQYRNMIRWPVTSLSCCRLLIIQVTFSRFDLKLSWSTSTQESRSLVFGDFPYPYLMLPQGFTQVNIILGQTVSTCAISKRFAVTVGIPSAMYLFRPHCGALGYCYSTPL